MTGPLVALQVGVGGILPPASKRLRTTSSARARHVGSAVHYTSRVCEMEARCARRSFKPESHSGYRDGTI
jgi:hypothetical protein